MSVLVAADLLTHVFRTYKLTHKEAISAMFIALGRVY